MTSYLDAVKAKCKRCEVTFFYESTNGRVKVFCPACLVLNKKEQSAAKRRKYKANDIQFGFSGEQLNDGAVMSHSEVAAVMGLTAETVRRIERTALTKCRKAFKMELLAKQLDNSLR